MKKIQKDPRITEGVEKLWAAFGETKRGQVLTWAAVEGVMGYSHRTCPGATIVNKFRLRLRRERGVVCHMEWSVGFRFLTHSETLRIKPRDPSDRARGQMNRLKTELKTVDRNKLTQLERQLLDLRTHEARRNRLELLRAKRAQDATYKPSEVNPQRKPN